MNKKDMKTLANKVIVITGASSGIGEAMAKVYAAQGAKVVLGARNVQKLQLLAGDIRARGGQAAYCGVDVTKPEECRELIETAVREFGGIDVLICNAGISMRAIFDDVDLGVLHRLMDVNFWGTVNCCKFALPYLQASKGSVVGISSVAGLHGLPGRTGYSASKYAMTGFLETLRIENLKKGLHVMIACPGFTASNVRFSALTADGKQQGATPRNESKMMTPEEVARIVAKGILRRKRLCLMESEGRATHFVKKFAPAFLDVLSGDVPRAGFAFQVAGSRMTGAGTYERFPPFCTLSAGPVFRRAGGGCLPTEYVRSRTKGGEKAG